MNLRRLLLYWSKVPVLALAPALFGRSQCPVLTRMFCNINVVTVDRRWLAFIVFTLICNEFNTDLGKAGVPPSRNGLPVPKTVIRTRNSFKPVTTKTTILLFSLKIKHFTQTICFNSHACNRPDLKLICKKCISACRPELELGQQFGGGDLKTLSLPGATWRAGGLPRWVQGASPAGCSQDPKS